MTDVSDRPVPTTTADDEPAPYPGSAVGGPGARPEDRGTLIKVALTVGVVALAVRALGPYVLYALLALAVSIVLHEFGHYWTAKRSGMKVTEFFVGFGPKIFSFRRGEVEYGLKAIPAGAYVRIIGMNDMEPIDDEDVPRAYKTQGTFKRLATVLAGPAMNLLIAFVLFTSLFLLHGRPSEAWAVGDVVAGSAAAEAGLQPDDRVLELDGEPVGTWAQFREQLADKAGAPVEFLIERDGEQLTRTVDLGWRLDAATAASFPSTPKLSAGDEIVSADGQPLRRYDDLRRVLAEPEGQTTLRVLRSGLPYELIVQRPYQLPERGGAGFLGVRMESRNTPETPVGAVAETGRILGTGVTGTIGVITKKFTPSGFGELIGQVGDAASTRASGPPVVEDPHVLTPVEGSPPADQLTAAAIENRPISIVGITQLGTSAAQSGWVEFLFLMAGVNLALGILNLIPLLPFDGGHASIAAYEGIRGRLRGAPYRADQAKLLPVVYAVFAVLLVFSASTILLDLLAPVQLR